MRLPSPFPLASLFLAGALAVLPVPSDAATVTFHIADETDPSEVTEATTVFINGHLVAHFELSASHPFGEVAVSVPAADRYEYALCGRITIRAPDGHSETHVLDDGATMENPSGRRLEALASDGFTTFFLAERTGGAAATPGDLHKTNVCSIPTS
jgi:hypothetical protein